MADYYIENNEIRIGINRHGAELVSFVRKEDKREFMWNGDADYWGRVSPVLFPFVGKLNNQTFKVDGKEYSKVPQHGYARDLDFDMVEQLEDVIWFELNSDDGLREKYPFSFQLRIGYRIEGKMVHVMWTVRNDSDRAMPFSIGAHPAFIMPNMEDKSNYLLDFHNGKSEMKCGVLDANGLLSDEERVVSLQDGKLFMNEELFARDALIFDAKDIHTVSINTLDNEPFIQLRFDTPLLGVWSPAGKKAPFVCIEPWFGRTDRFDYDGDLYHREYGNCIEPGHSFNKEYVIELV